MVKIKGGRLLETTLIWVGIIGLVVGIIGFNVAPRGPDYVRIEGIPQKTVSSLGGCFLLVAFVGGLALAVAALIYLRGVQLH